MPPGGLQRSPTHAVVELCTCTGEPMERLSSSDRQLLGYLDARSPAATGDQADDR